MTIAVLGEALIDLIAEDDGDYRPYLGGSPYNVAIGLARQGVDVNYVSPLSDDAFGDQLHDALHAEGVSLSIARRSKYPTSIAIISVDESGAPTYRIYRDRVADKDITYEEITAELPQDLRVFHTGSLAITPSQLPKIRKLFGLMRQRGVVISLDVNVRLRACLDTEAYLAGIRSLLPMADIVKASNEDLEPFEISNNARDTAESVHAEMGSGTLVLTEGAAGAVLYTRGGTIESRAVAVADIADTVGAGDTFHAAFLASLLRAGGLEKTAPADPNVYKNALAFAAAAAAINLGRAGCNPPLRQEVAAYLSARRNR